VSVELLPEVIRIGRSVATARLVLDHLAGFPGTTSQTFAAWLRATDHLAELPYVAVKISGLATKDQSMGKSDVNGAVAYLAHIFGSSRLMVGSDWPVCLRAGSWSRSLARAIEAGQSTSITKPGDLLLGSATAIYPRLKLVGV